MNYGLDSQAGKEGEDLPESALGGSIRFPQRAETRSQAACLMLFNKPSN